MSNLQEFENLGPSFILILILHTRKFHSGPMTPPKDTLGGVTVVNFDYTHKLESMLAFL